MQSNDFFPSLCTQQKYALQKWTKGVPNLRQNILINDHADMIPQSYALIEFISPSIPIY
jgi:hypothetical protein